MNSLFTGMVVGCWPRRRKQLAEFAKGFQNFRIPHRGHESGDVFASARASWSAANEGLWAHAALVFAACVCPPSIHGSELWRQNRRPLCGRQIKRKTPPVPCVTVPLNLLETGGNPPDCFRLPVKACRLQPRL